MQQEKQFGVTDGFLKAVLNPQDSEAGKAIAICWNMQVAAFSKVPQDPSTGCKQSVSVLRQYGLMLCKIKTLEIHCNS